MLTLSSGEGFQIFNYPKIKVNVDVSFGSTITGILYNTCCNRKNNWCLSL